MGHARAEALEELRRLLAGIPADEPEAAAARLLERIAARDDAEELRAALVEMGALLVVHPLGSMVLEA